MMATQTQDGNDSLWDVSVNSKSWVELVEDEDSEFALMNRSDTAQQDVLTSVKMETESQVVASAGETTKIETKTVVVVKEVSNKHEPRNVPSIITEEESCDVTIGGLSTISEESNDTTPPLKNVTQTYANILKNNSPTPGIAPAKSEVKIEIKKELSKDFLHEDISLTGHIEGFQLTSPCKPQGFKTPTKTIEGPTLRSSPRNLKRKILQEAPNVKIPDDVLMPSPSKILRASDKLADVNSPKPVNSPKLNFSGRASGNSSGGKRYSNSRKRPRDMNTPPSNKKFEKPPPELETNEETLSRRQKQIDYGKNTIGYERYRQLVPKESRKSIHPKTPPMHLKYSRRAWEGMVKIWRQRLHFWDPPSEGGGDPACLEADMSDMSDISSTDGSLPSTPVQDLKRRQVYTSPAASSSKRSSAKSLSVSTSSDKPASTQDDDFDNNGCQPLSP